MILMATLYIVGTALSMTDIPPQHLWWILALLLWFIHGPLGLPIGI